MTDAYNGLTIDEIRRGNLEVLDAEAGSLAAIAEAIRAAKADDADAATKDYANYLSQVRGGTRNIGDAMARDLELGMKKPRGWMDEAHFRQADLSVEGKEAGQIIMAMEPDARDAWMKLLRRENEKNPKRSAGNPFGDIPKGGRDKPKRRRGSGGTQ